MKNRTLPIAVGVILLSVALAFYANMTSADLKKAVEQERYQRLNAEKVLLKAQQRVNALEAELGDAKSKMASIEKILTDGQAAKQELKAELEAVKKEREALQGQIKPTETEPVE